MRNGAVATAGAALAAGLVDDGAVARGRASAAGRVVASSTVNVGLGRDLRWRRSVGRRASRSDDWKWPSPIPAAELRVTAESPCSNASKIRGKHVRLDPHAGGRSLPQRSPRAGGRLRFGVPPTGWCGSPTA